MTDLSTIAALQTTAMRALMQTWLLSLPTVQPTQPNTPWLDHGTLRLTPGTGATPARAGLLGTDRGSLTSPVDGAPLLSLAGV